MAADRRGRPRHPAGLRGLGAGQLRCLVRRREPRARPRPRSPRAARRRGPPPGGSPSIPRARAVGLRPDRRRGALRPDPAGRLGAARRRADRTAAQLRGGLRRHRGRHLGGGRGLRSRPRPPPPPAASLPPSPAPPLYFLLSAGVARLTGAGFLPLRLVSLAASLASMGLLFRIVTRDASGWLGGLVAAGLFAASFRMTGGFYDLARVDSLSVALLLACLLVAAGARRPAAFAAAGVLLCLAALTKQSALVAGAPIAAWLLARPGGLRGGLAFLAGALVPLALVSIPLQAGSAGWYGVTVAGVLAGHRVDPTWWAGFWTPHP